MEAAGRRLRSEERLKSLYVNTSRKWYVRLTDMLQTDQIYKYAGGPVRELVVQ